MTIDLIRRIVLLVYREIGCHKRNYSHNCFFYIRIKYRSKDWIHVLYNYESTDLRKSTFRSKLAMPVSIRRGPPIKKYLKRVCS